MPSTKHPNAPMWIHDDGRQSRYPSRDEANRDGFVIYDEGERCDRCNGSRARYVDGDRCVGCSQLAAGLFYNSVKDGLEKWITIDDLDYIHHTFYYRQRDLLPSKIYDIIVDGLATYNADPLSYTIKPKQCKNGHIGLYNNSGKCQTCAATPKKLSQRQVAMKAGDTKYTPVTPCTHCHTIAPRRVDNGKCDGCTSIAPDNRETADSVMMRECPDMVIDKVTARDMGFKVYRTGNECKKGHTAWRYVSTGTCIKCLRGL